MVYSLIHQPDAETYNWIEHLSVAVYANTELITTLTPSEGNKVHLVRMICAFTPLQVNTIRLRNNGQTYIQITSAAGKHIDLNYGGNGIALDDINIPVFVRYYGTITSRVVLKIVWRDQP